MRVWYILAVLLGPLFASAGEVKFIRHNTIAVLDDTLRTVCVVHLDRNTVGWMAELQPSGYIVLTSPDRKERFDFRFSAEFSSPQYDFIRFTVYTELKNQGQLRCENFKSPS